MQFIFVPKRVYVGAVSSEGETELNAFDNCLVKLGIGDVSLVKTTSILPNDVEITEKLDTNLVVGSNVPAIYSYTISNQPGETIAAAMAIGRTEKGPTLVAETSDRGINRKEAEELVIKMLRDMVKTRNLKLLDIKVYSVEHTVKKIGCVIVVAVEIE